MKKIGFNGSNAQAFAGKQEIEEIKEEVLAAKKKLVEKSGVGKEFLGWIDLPDCYDREEFKRIIAAAEKIRRDSRVLVVVGIGGSYLGARAAIDFLQPDFYNELSPKRGKTPEVYYAGNNISGSYLSGLLTVIGERDFSVNVVSKSGTTTEPAIAFRILKDKLEKKYGKAEAARRIYATTDMKKGALRSMAEREGYETFAIPDDVGGRYSVLTAVGLLPIAVTGADIERLLEGANDARNQALHAEYEENGALQYAAVRNILYRKGKSVEILAGYEPSLHYLTEWWKQLFGESEGKDGKGILPIAADFTTDLHSMGQYIQDGRRMLFETVLDIEVSGERVVIPKAEDDLDNLNYLAGQTLDFVNQKAMEGTVLAHMDGGVPNLTIHVPGRDEYSLGQLIYFFEFACGVSGYLLGVNPFNQPGVESYKQNMFALLGKPGYEALRENLEKNRNDFSEQSDIL